jgi:GNAT superfamily N-acetyltransferase
MVELPELSTVRERYSPSRNAGMVARIGPVLRQLNPGSQSGILDLLRESGLPARSEPHLIAPAAEWIAGAYLADELTGFVQAGNGLLEGVVETTLFVKAKRRRQGIGTLLLRATLDWASLHRAHALRFACARTDWPMRHLAEKFGARLDLVLGQIPRIDLQTAPSRPA